MTTSQSSWKRHLKGCSPFQWNNLNPKICKNINYWEQTQIPRVPTHMVSVILVFKETTELSSRVAGVPFHIPASNVWDLLYHILISIWSCHYFSYSCSNMYSSTKFLIMKQKHYPTENTVVLKTEYEVWGNLANSGKIIHESEMGFPGDSVVKNPCRRHKSDMYTHTHTYTCTCMCIHMDKLVNVFFLNKHITFVSFLFLS